MTHPPLQIPFLLFYFFEKKIESIPNKERKNTWKEYITPFI